MSTFDASTNVSLRRDLTEVETGGKFTEIPANGDGNCAFNALSLALAALIRQDQLILSNEVAERWLAAMCAEQRVQDLKNRIKFYRVMGKSFPCYDLIDDIQNFIDLINNKPTVNDVRAYIQSQTSRDQIAALQVCLAPSLRQLSYDIAVDKNSHKEYEVQNDGEQGSDNDIYNVCEFMGVQGRVYVQDPILRQTFHRSPGLKMMDGDPLYANGSKPVIHILQKGGHFDLLVTEDSLHALQNPWSTLPDTRTLNSEQKRSRRAHSESTSKSTVDNDLKINDHHADVDSAIDYVHSVLKETDSRRSQISFDELYAHSLDHLQHEKGDLDEASLLKEAFVTALESGLQSTSKQKTKYSDTLQHLGFFKVERVSHSTASNCRAEAVSTDAPAATTAVA